MLRIVITVIIHTMVFQVMTPYDDVVW